MHRVPTRLLLLPFLLSALGACTRPHSAPPQPVETPLAEIPAQHDARMAWWRDARFGMFIHWGVYAQAAGVWNGKPVDGVGEWIMHHGRIAPADYKTLAPRFNPVKFNARAWARTAREAGMKYIVITSKHHDGFCLWNSALTDWDIIDATPFGRDILKELAAACRDEGIRLCFYHSIMDWSHPLAKKATWPAYRDHMKGQLKELLTSYGPIGVLWFDGEWIDEWTEEQGRDLYDFVRTQQPAIIVNNRVGKGRDGMAGLSTSRHAAGDFGTPEQEIPTTGQPGIDWESCMTMNDTWGFKASDSHWKSATSLIRMLSDCASKGGNFLLNVGPTGLGEIPQPSLDRLNEVGQWMRINSEAIYGTGPSPFKKLPWGRATTRLDSNHSGTLYLHIFDWPADQSLTVPGLRTRVRSASLLGASIAIPTSRRGDDLLINLPSAPTNPHVSILALELDGPLDIAPPPPPPPISPDASGHLHLSAVAAELTGPALRIESIAGQPSLGFWTSPEASASWPVELPAGRYTAAITFSCLPSNSGGGLTLKLGDSAIQQLTTATNSWSDFQTITLSGVLSHSGGRATVTLRPAAPFKPALMNLRRIELIPAP